MKFLKLQKGNITHKFASIPQNYQELERLVKKIFKVDFSSHKIYFQSTPLMNQSDYNFLIQQSESLNNTLKLIVQNVSYDYYLSFDSKNKLDVYEQAPNIQIIQRVERPVIFKEPQQKKQERKKQIRIIVNEVDNKDGSKIWKIQAEGFQDMGVFCENSGRKLTLGDIKLLEGENNWRFWYKENGVKKLYGKRITLFNEKKKTQIILEKARKVQETLGANTIDLIKFIKRNQLEQEPTGEIIDRFIEEL